MLELDTEVPSPSAMADALGGGEVITVPVPHDCIDGFCHAWWRRPEAYLDPSVRAGISGIARLPAADVERGMTRLADDLESGAWRAAHADLLDRTEIDAGYRLVVAAPGADIRVWGRTDHMDARLRDLVERLRRRTLRRIHPSQPVVHHGATVRGKGPWEVVTGPERWAYALELPAASDTPAGPIVIRCELTVTTGVVGAAVIGHDGSIVFEAECVPEDGRMAIEHVLPEGYRSIVFRNNAPTGVRSSVRVESVQTFESSADEVRREIVIDPGVFVPYEPWVGTTPAGYFTDFLGVRTRADVWAFSDELSAIYNTERREALGYSLDSEQELDLFPLLEAVNAAGRTFVMISLGAGWGRWLSVGALASEQTGREYRLVGVEAEPQHFEWMERHFRDNKLRPDWSRLHYAAASDRSGTLWFRVGDSAAWYGQSIVSEDEVAEGGRDGAEDTSGTDYLGIPLRRVQAVDMEEVIGDLETVDYLHMDVQGAELDVLSARPDLLQARVKDSQHRHPFRPDRARPQAALSRAGLDMPSRHTDVDQSAPTVRWGEPGD